MSMHTLIIFLSTFVGILLIGMFESQTGSLFQCISLLPATAEPTPPMIVTIEGALTCLPHRDREHQTFECTIGLRGTDGQYYALVRKSGRHILNEFTIGQQVRVTGHFTTPKSTETYDIMGTIEINSMVDVSSKK